MEPQNEPSAALAAAPFSEAQQDEVFAADAVKDARSPEAAPAVPAPAEAAPAEPAPAVFEPASFEPEELRAISESLVAEFDPLPTESELLLLPVDPNRVHAYWHVSDSARAQETAAAGAPFPLVLRVSGEDGAPFDVPVHSEHASSYVDLWNGEQAVSAALGERAADGAFTPLTECAQVPVPRSESAPYVAPAEPTVLARGAVDDSPDHRNEWSPAGTMNDGGAAFAPFPLVDAWAGPLEPTLDALSRQPSWEHASSAEDPTAEGAAAPLVPLRAAGGHGLFGLTSIDHAMADGAWLADEAPTGAGAAGASGGDGATGPAERPAWVTAEPQPGASNSSSLDGASADSAFPSVPFPLVHAEHVLALQDPQQAAQRLLDASPLATGSFGGSALVELSTLSSSALSNPSSASFAPVDFELHVELHIHGRARPGSKLTLFGEPVRLRPDGSFSLRHPLPRGAILCPVHWSSPDAPPTSNGSSDS